MKTTIQVTSKRTNIVVVIAPYSKTNPIKGKPTTIKERKSTMKIDVKY